MNKTTKIIIASLWFAIAFMLTVVLVKGINGTFSFRNFNVDNKGWSYNLTSNVETISTGVNTELSTFSESFSNIDIDLVNEDFILEVWNNNYTEITIESSFDESKRPKINLSDNTLQIKAPNRNNVRVLNSQDKVVVKIPENLGKKLNKVNIDVVSGAILVSSIVSELTSASTVSGRISLDGCDFEELRTNSVSGNSNVTQSSVQEIISESISGQIRISSDISKNFECSAVSGDIIVETNKMPSLGGDCETVSGSVKIYLPENNGFVLDYQSTSGSITNEFTGSKMKKSGENSYKSGGIDFDVETISGSISISKI